MSSRIQHIIKQARPFDSLESEVLIGLQVAAQRILEPWASYLKQEAGITPNQYNVLRILRGAQPDGLKCTDIGERMISRGPDVTRLTDRLIRMGLVQRERDSDDRRRVTICVTPKGLDTLRSLDAAASAMPGKALGHLGQVNLERLKALLEDVIGTLESDR